MKTAFFSLSRLRERGGVRADARRHAAPGSPSPSHASRGPRPGALRGRASALGLALGAKLALLPLLSALACRLVGLDGVPAAVAVLFQALPSAPSSYILARQLGGDAALMAAILTAQIIAAALTLPIVLSFLSAG